MATLGNLLSVDSLIQSPFIVVEIGGYTFGNFAEKTAQYSRRVTYPTMVKSIDIVKINGTVNQYTINMTYQIQAGEDPNMFDKVISKVGYGNIKISYGDCNSPANGIFLEESALITKVSSNVDFQNSRIDYIIYATGASILSQSSRFYFSAKTAKPSQVIISVLRNPAYGLKDIFKGMNTKRIQKILQLDDKEVYLHAQNNMSPIEYIKYLATNMVSKNEVNSSKKLVKDANYYLIIHDDAQEGSYFEISKIRTLVENEESIGSFLVDVGYPSNTNLVMNFKLNNTDAYSIFYEYAGQINQSNYVYTLDNDGNMITTYSPSIARSNRYANTTEANKTWWTNVTSFNVQATLTLKGLVRPQMLMNYVLVNSYFYGLKHNSSGLYVIVKEEDRVDRSGYRTILTLQRLKGAEDAFDNVTITRNVSTTPYKLYRLASTSRYLTEEEASEYTKSTLNISFASRDDNLIGPDGEYDYDTFNQLVENQLDLVNSFENLTYIDSDGVARTINPGESSDWALTITMAIDNGAKVYQDKNGDLYLDGGPYNKYWFGHIVQGNTD